MNKFIPLSIPNFEGNERKYVDDAIDQGWVSTGGAYIIELEKRLATYLHTDNVAACQSGTSALHLSLVEAGVVPGDIVLVPPVTFIAAVNPVKYQFAEPVFIDCDDSLCMDPIKLRRFCDEQCKFKDGQLVHDGKIVKALVVVHVFGNMADMESIMDTADKYNIKVIEDATEALGTRYTEGRYAGKYAGTIGDFGAFSFNGNKIITTGGGGAVTANKKEVVEHIRFLSTQAKTDPHYYIHDEIGYNYRMTNLQAALGVAQMEELPEFVERKHRNYDLYCELFRNFELAYLLGYRKGTYSNQWFYSLVIDRSKVKATMRAIITKLQTEYGIETRAIWGLINEQLPYVKEECFELECGPYYSERVLNIPSSTQLKEDDIYYAAEKIMAVLKELEE
ncbi:LegC family aminotransferase [Clostridium sp. Marseille-P3244]|uniref:LegC family aminotransferase n=1 Tax=Clostridium sp. Marseille-P3244 TaxID=1871020 RepID=UPI0009311F6E|nr:LegC family aminotransferase [Clostridium sp. Marseille-P3244]